MAFTDEEKQKILEKEQQGLQPRQQQAVDAMRSRGELGPPLPISRRRQVHQTIGRGLLEATLGTAASLAPIPGSRVAAVSRFAAARSLFQRAIQAGAGEAGGSLIAESFDPSQDPVRQALTAGAFGLGGEIVGSALTAPIRLIRKAAAGIKPGAEEAIQRIGERGGVITPGLLVESQGLSRLTDISENISEASFFGGGRILASRARANQLATNIIEEFADQYRQGRRIADIDEALLFAKEGAEIVHADSVEGAYIAVDKAVRSSTFGAGIIADRLVNLRPVKSFALRRVRQLRRGGIGAKQVASFIKEEILSKPDFVSFQEASGIRSGLLRTSRLATERTEPVRVTSDLLAGIVDNQLTTAGKSLPEGSKAIELWRNANALVKEGKELFKSDLAKSLARARPGKVYEVAVKGRTKQEIKLLEKLLGGPDSEAMDLIKGRFMDDMLIQSIDKADNIIGDRLLSNLRRAGETFDALFPGKQGIFKKNINLLQLLQARPSAERVGSIFVQLKQSRAGGVIFEMLTAGLAGAGGFAAAGGPGAVAGAVGFLITPAIWARVLTNPRMAKALVLGTKPATSAVVARRAMSQIAAVLVREGAIPFQPTND